MPWCHINAGWLRGFKNARGIQCILIKYVHANNLRNPLRNLKCHIFYVQQFLDSCLNLGHGGSSQKLNLWSCKCVHLHTRCHLESSSAVLQNPSCTVLDVDDLRVVKCLLVDKWFGITKGATGMGEMQKMIKYFYTMKSTDSECSEYLLLF